jgi:hypothetical protein
MKIFLLSVMLVVSLLAATLASAQSAVVNTQGKCPSGWRKSNGYCVAGHRGSSRAVQSIGGKCPSGWTNRQGYCVPRSERASDAVAKVNGECPSGHYSSSNGFCMKR